MPTNKELLGDLSFDDPHIISKLIWRIGQSSKPITNYVASLEFFGEYDYENY